MPGEFREEYLEAVYDLTEGGGSAKTLDIARKLKVKSGSVSEMLRKLSCDGYVDYNPYKGAVLTPKGMAAATKLKRKHRLLERFLYDVLHLRKDRVHEEACRMEHSLSDKVADALDRALGHPKRCPDDGKLIPPKSGAVRVKAPTLADIRPGSKLLVTGFAGGKDVKSSLRDIGIHEGAIVELVARQPARGPLVVKAGCTTVTLGRGMASKVRVVPK